MDAQTEDDSGEDDDNGRRLATLEHKMEALASQMERMEKLLRSLAIARVE